MSDVKVEHEAVLTRAEVAQWIADVGKALDGDGTVSIRLAGSTVELHVPDPVRCEIEVEVDGDEVELEIELTWSTARTGAKGARPGLLKQASPAGRLASTRTYGYPPRACPSCRPPPTLR